jgi:hypothetical protein
VEAEEQHEAKFADRKVVREFFSYKVNNEEVKLRSVDTAETLGYSMVVGFGIGLVAGLVLRSLAVGVLLTLLTIGGLFALGFTHERQSRERELQERRDAQKQNHAEFAKLAADTRAIQANDVLKAFHRVFMRTQVDADQLKVLDNRYVSREERALFDEDTLDREIRALMPKSVRLLSEGDYTNKALRKIRWTDTHREELFFNPTRLVVLFLTPTQVIICDVQIDSMDGDLREEIQRISLQNIVSIHFIGNRIRFSLDKEKIVQMAEDLGHSPEEVREIRKDLDVDESDREWVQEEITSDLRITRTDGGAVSFPIRKDFYLGRRRTLLDQETTLSDDDKRVDMMINELNRLVEEKN